MRNRFARLAVVTTATTYVLITVGALVRALGAGMGCPDWPRCYGHWIPPSGLGRLPARLAWIEYLNRLLGSATGLLVAATVVVALVDHRRNGRVVRAAFGAFVGVGIAGWLGKLVVEKHLAPAWVTVHLLVALAVVALLIEATVASLPTITRGGSASASHRRQLVAGTVGIGAITVVQIALGTRVRASIEHVARSVDALPRDQWLAHVGSVDATHRTLALIVLVLTCALARHAWRAEPDRTMRLLSGALVVCVVLQIAAGASLAYLALPPLMQIAHVTLASMIFGVLVTMGLLASRVRDEAEPAEASTRAFDAEMPGLEATRRS